MPNKNTKQRRLKFHSDSIWKQKVPIVFTSAGNPKTWTKLLKDNGIKVAHVVSSSKFALKCPNMKKLFKIFFWEWSDVM